MEALAAEVRKLIYTIICFQCLLQLTEGSAYQKYLKFFSYLLTMCICCSVIVRFVGQVEESLADADSLYENWEKEWEELMAVEEPRIEAEYKKQDLWENKIMEKAYEEYDTVEGGGADVGSDSAETAGDG